MSDSINYGLNSTTVVADLSSKNLYVCTPPFFFNIPEFCDQIPVYGLLSTDCFGTLGIRVMFSEHMGVTPSVVMIADKWFGLKQNPELIFNNEFACYGVITRPTRKIEIQHNLECVVCMSKYSHVVLALIQEG